MKRAKTIAFGAGTMLLAGYGAIAQNAPGVMALTADEMKWSSQGGLALPGMEQVNLIGNPTKAGPYITRSASNFRQGLSCRRISIRMRAR